MAGSSETPEAHLGVTDIVGECADQGVQGHAGRRTDTREEDGGQTAGDGGDSGEMGFVCPKVTFTWFIPEGKSPFSRQA